MFKEAAHLQLDCARAARPFAGDEAVCQKIFSKKIFLEFIFL